MMSDARANRAAIVDALAATRGQRAARARRRTTRGRRGGWGWGLAETREAKHNNKKEANKHRAVDVVPEVIARIKPANDGNARLLDQTCES